ncbi:amino acid--tRNA ligase-related protein [Streptomyces lavendulae]|uniref:amino acid--tRNA ligase-related protein n=1 Tax=Streptomyces lavendulae TaxID=1914 RepID=UPI0033F043BB
MSILQPPSIHGSNEPDAFVRALRSPWYALVADLFHTVRTATADYANGRGLRNLPFPLTTRTVTCPTALGSDSEPVPVSVLGVDTYLPDSMQFALEYGCRLAPGGCWDIQPSYRGETPDETHLNQYTHSEAEIPGGLEEMTDYVDGYVKALAAAVLDQHGDRLATARGNVSHLERMAGHGAPFEQLTFAEAVRIVGDTEGCVHDAGTWRSLTRKGERLLMERVSEFVWVHHFDSLAVPFYQAFGDENGQTARNADLFFGLGEIVGGRRASL